MARPGARAAARERNANRTDQVTSLPVAAIPGQQYGEQAQQVADQRAIPTGPQPVAGGGAPAPAAPAAGGPPDLSALAAQFSGPGNSLSLTRPTERPNEPVTHGLPIGPGGGPEVLSGVGAATRDNAIQQGTVAHLLANLAAQPNAPSAVQDLAARAQGGVQ